MQRALEVLSELAAPDTAGHCSVLLVVDSHVTMRVWDTVVDQLRHGLAHFAQLGPVTVTELLHSDDTEPDRVQLADPPAAADQRVVLVLTDGLAAGWRSDAVLPLLRELGGIGPLAVLQLPPQRLWFRTGLDVQRMRLQADVPWAPNTRLHWELRTSPLEPTDNGAPEGVVPVPVLELTERSLAGWVGLVTGRSPGWLEMSGVRAREWKRRVDAARAVPWIDDVPDPASAVPPWARVSEFRAAASPAAFALATRLAAAPLTPPVMRAVTESVPGTGPAHLSELLMSGLVRPASGEADRAAGVLFAFGPNIREELLALWRGGRARRGGARGRRGGRGRPRGGGPPP
ncbi:SAV_2336 N-terminal domain-related protein, partial [Streptomyces sp. NPDC059766]|uniref:SAV_2336 N-terminal domain-related protein n=1 Tax=Streptomyces sp. NPDC059766 TaxID=3346940 RepID=UPI003666F0B3